MTTDEELPELMTVKETSAYLRIPLPTVYYLVQRGQLPAIQIGGRWRIKRSLLDRDVLKNDQGGQPTVLVVDDDPALQTLFKQFLKKAGFGRIVVGTGAEALTYAKKQKFDLYITPADKMSKMHFVQIRNSKEIHFDLAYNDQYVKKYFPVDCKISLLEDSMESRFLRYFFMLRKQRLDFFKKHKQKIQAKNHLYSCTGQAHSQQRFRKAYL